MAYIWPSQVRENNTPKTPRAGDGWKGEGMEGGGREALPLDFEGRRLVWYGSGAVSPGVICLGSAGFDVRWAARDNHYGPGLYTSVSARYVHDECSGKAGFAHECEGARGKGGGEGEKAGGGGLEEGVWGTGGMGKGGEEWDPCRRRLRVWRDPLHKISLL